MIIKDQLNRNIKLAETPKKIVSVVPSQTELLYDLGLEKEVAGITKFCVHPKKWFKEKQRVGGTKTLKIDVIDALNPDLIIANKEENEKSQIETLCEKYPVYISNVFNLGDALKMIRDVGELTSTKVKAQQLCINITQGFAQLNPKQNNKTCLYLIWKNPYMTCGNNTFVNDMLKRCGFKNLLEGRYPELTIEEMKQLNPEFILLSSEPFPFQQKHIHEFQKELPKTKIVLVNGEMFSWYGSRLVKASNYFQRFCT